MQIPKNVDISTGFTPQCICFGAKIQIGAFIDSLQLCVSDPEPHSNKYLPKAKIQPIYTLYGCYARAMLLFASAFGAVRFDLLRSALL